jgi:hypothetical protein
MMLPGRKVTVSLTDGSAVSGVTGWSWPWLLRVRDVHVRQGAVPGVVLVPWHSIVTVQVVS